MVVQDKSPQGPPRKSGLSCAECRQSVFLYLLTMESSDTIFRSKLKCDRYAQKILHIFVIKFLTSYFPESFHVNHVFGEYLYIEYQYD